MTSIWISSPRHPKTYPRFGPSSQKRKVRHERVTVNPEVTQNQLRSSGWRTSHAPQPSQSVGGPEPVLSLSKDLAPHRGHRRQVHVAGVAEIWDSMMPVKLNSVSTGPNPFISKQKQNHTRFAWYFPPNAHNTGRALVLTLHSSEAGSRPVKRFWARPAEFPPK